MGVGVGVGVGVCGCGCVWVCVCVGVCVCVCVHMCTHSVVSNSASLWTVALQALSMELSGKYTGVGCQFLP